MRLSYSCWQRSRLVRPARTRSKSESSPSTRGLAALGAKVAATQRREASLRAQVESASSEIRALAQRVNDISIELEPLERELELRRERLRRLNELFRLQTERLKLLRRQHAIAMRRLGDRVDKLYRQEETDTLSLLLSSASFTDALDVFDYLQRIADEDKRVANEVGAVKTRVRDQREQTRTTRKRHRQETRVVAVRVGQVRALRDRLAASRSGMVAAQVERQEDLEQLTAVEREQLAHIDELQQQSAALAAKIQAAQAASGTGGGSPSAAGYIWPVLGPVTSPFGWRWGRMHEGHRHRRRVGDADQSRCSRHRHPRRLAGRLREPHRHRSRRRRCDGLRPPVGSRRRKRRLSSHRDR